MTSSDKQDKRRLIGMLLSYSASSASLLTANIAQLITFAILARSFGAQEFGGYVAFIAITSIAVHLCGLGASECLVRRVPQDPACFPRIFGHNLILTLTSGAVLVALGTIILPEFISFGASHSQSVLTTFQLIVTNVVLVRLIMLGESIFLAHSKYGAANASVIGFAFVRTITAALACLFFQVRTVEDWATWQLFAHLLTLILYAYFALRIGRPHYVVEREEVRLGLLFATPFIFRAVRQNVDLLVLGFVAGAEVVGSYGVARRITDSSYMAIDALNRLVYPRLAVASMSGIHYAFRLTIRILGVALTLGLVAAMVIFLSAPYMPLIFGPEYVSLPHFLQIMAWLIIFIALWSVAVDLLGASGLHSSRAWVLNMSNGIGAILIGLAAWLWPPYGIFIAGYMIELSIVLAAWIVVKIHVDRSLAKSLEASP